MDFLHCRGSGAAWLYPLWTGFLTLAASRPGLCSVPPRTLGATAVRVTGRQKGSRGEKGASEGFSSPSAFILGGPQALGPGGAPERPR